jgi:hypothetical protein
MLRRRLTRAVGAEMPALSENADDRLVVTFNSDKFDAMSVRVTGAGAEE